MHVGTELCDALIEDEHAWRLAQGGKTDVGVDKQNTA